MEDLLKLWFLSSNLMKLSGVSNLPKKVSIEGRLKSWNMKFNFKWNPSYLSRLSNLSCGSNFIIGPQSNKIISKIESLLTTFFYVFTSRKILMKIYENILKKLIKARVVNKRFSWQSSHLLSTNDSHMTASGWINIVYSTLITIALKNRYTNFFFYT